MQKQYVVPEGGAWDSDLLQAHLDAELNFTTGVSSAGSNGFIVYFDDESQIPEVDAAVASYPFDPVQIAIENKQDFVQGDCQFHIYANYSAPVQQSMALGVYPSEMADAMITFIAACIEEENRVHDLLALATTVEEVDAINPVWPEVA